MFILSAIMSFVFSVAIVPIATTEPFFVSSVLRMMVFSAISVVVFNPLTLHFWVSNLNKIKVKHCSSQIYFVFKQIGFSNIYLTSFLPSVRAIRRVSGLSVSRPIIPTRGVPTRWTPSRIPVSGSRPVGLPGRTVSPLSFDPSVRVIASIARGIKPFIGRRIPALHCPRRSNRSFPRMFFLESIGRPGFYHWDGAEWTNAGHGQAT